MGGVSKSGVAHDSCPHSPDPESLLCCLVKVDACILTTGLLQVHRSAGPLHITSEYP